jgi:23S rRNA pseudouridine2605 synthase
MTDAEKSLSPRYGVARVISKSGLGSRTQAVQWISEGRVRVNGRVVRDAEFPVRRDVDRVTVDGQTQAPARMVVMLNKPRGLVTTTKDEQGRDTVYRCFQGAALPWLAPVGRLDKASEGLLLFSNDPAWAASITAPATGPEKRYHVQIGCLADSSLLKALEQGVELQGERGGAGRLAAPRIRAKSARCLRAGGKNSWLEIVLDEGRNRQIRRLLAAFDVPVLRLVRIAIGSLVLGDLPKGGWRALTEEEINALTGRRLA